jgi:carboxymethylenebutenolidase
MCDELTLADEAKLTRRAFAVLGAGGALAAAVPAFATGKKLAESVVTIPTADGTADAFFVHPARGKYPAIIIWPDIGGLRDAFKEMARRLAAAGYAVLAVNHYYRSAPAPVLANFALWRTPEGQAKIRPMVGLVTADAVARDAAAFVAWLDKQAAVNRKRGIGNSGYCMGGPFTVRSAAAVPDRIKAAASFHGAGLVSAADNSPDKLLAKTKAAFLIAIAKNDDARAPTDKDALKAAAKAAGRPAEIEVYGGDHGWCVVDSPSYHAAEAERAWARMLVLFGGL